MIQNAPPEAAAGRGEILDEIGELRSNPRIARSSNSYRTVLKFNTSRTLKHVALKNDTLVLGINVSEANYPLPVIG